LSTVPSALCGSPDGAWGKTRCIHALFHWAYGVTRCRAYCCLHSFCWSGWHHRQGRPGVPFQWVGSGRVTLRHVSPIPPLEPCWRLSSHTAHERRTFTGNVHFASSTEHSPWTALRVRWVPLYCFLTLSLRAFAMYVAFLHSDYYAPSDCL